MNASKCTQVPTMTTAGDNVVETAGSPAALLGDGMRGETERSDGGDPEGRNRHRGHDQNGGGYHDRHDRHDCGPGHDTHRGHHLYGGHYDNRSWQGGDRRHD